MRLLNLMIFLLTSFMLYSQPINDSITKSKFLGKKSFFTNDLKFPSDMNQNGKVILSILINEEGVLDSINIDLFTNEVIANDVVNVLLASRKKWTPTYINSEPVPHWYVIVFNYNYLGVVSSIEKAVEPSKKHFKYADKSYNKEKYKKALKYINKAIELRPYESSYYSLRYKILYKLNRADEAEKDKLKYNELESKILDVIDFSKFGISRKI